MNSNLPTLQELRSDQLVKAEQNKLNVLLNSEPPKDDPVGGPSAQSAPEMQNEMTSQAPSAAAISCSSSDKEVFQETAVPMHGFLTDSEKEVSDVNLISGLARAKEALN